MWSSGVDHVSLDESRAFKIFSKGPAIAKHSGVLWEHASFGSVNWHSC
jgi:hypothetical protein